MSVLTLPRRPALLKVELEHDLEHTITMLGEPFTDEEAIAWSKDVIRHSASLAAAARARGEPVPELRLSMAESTKSRGAAAGGAPDSSEGGAKLDDPSPKPDDRTPQEILAEAIDRAPIERFPELFAQKIRDIPNLKIGDEPFDYTDPAHLASIPTAWKTHFAQELLDYSRGRLSEEQEGNSTAPGEHSPTSSPRRSTTSATGSGG